MIRIILCLSFIAVVSAYSDKIDRQKSIEINNQANKLFATATFDIDVADKVLKMYNEAIIIDSTYFPSYENKARLLCQWGRHLEAFQTYEQCLNVFPERSASIHIVLGIISDRLDRLEEANKHYMNAIELHDSLIVKSQDSMLVKLKISRATSVLLLKGKEEGIREYEILKVKYPTDKYLESLHKLFYTYNKTNYLKDFCK